MTEGAYKNGYDRFSRQILFSEIGEAGQQRLAQSRVAIVGCGALEVCRRSCWLAPEWALFV